MRKFFVTLMASMMSFSAAFAFWTQGADTSYELGFGYRQDRIKWTEASEINNLDSTSGIVGMRSTLDWRRLNIFQVEAKGKYVTCDNLYFRGYADYGWIHNGKNRDSDYLTPLKIREKGKNEDPDTSEVLVQDGETEEFSRSRARTKGRVYDFSAAVGYQFRMCDDSLFLSPIVGYSWHGQKLKDRDLKIEIPEEFSGSIEGLNSHYHTRWNGPFIGLDLDYRFCLDWSFFASYEYHIARYHGHGFWNMRPDMEDGFNHHSRRSYGQILTAGFKWDFCECWSVGLTGKYQYFHTGRGSSKALIGEVHNRDVGIECYAVSPLKKVQWHSASIMLDVGFMF